MSSGCPDPAHSRASAIHWRNSDQGAAQRLRLRIRVLMRGNARLCRLLPIGQRTLAQFLSGSVQLDAQYLEELDEAMDWIEANAGDLRGVKKLPFRYHCGTEIVESEPLSGAERPPLW